MEGAVAGDRRALDVAFELACLQGLIPWPLRSHGWANKSGVMNRELVKDCRPESKSTSNALLVLT
jgi:hypothetical protein